MCIDSVWASMRKDEWIEIQYVHPQAEPLCTDNKHFQGEHRGNDRN